MKKRNMRDEKNPELLNKKEVEKFCRRIQAEAEKLFGRLDINGGGKGDPPWLEVIMVDRTRYRLPIARLIPRTIRDESEETLREEADAVEFNLSVAFHDWEQWNKMKQFRSMEKKDKPC